MGAINKGAGQTVWMRRLVGASDVNFFFTLTKSGFHANRPIMLISFLIHFIVK